MSPRVSKPVRVCLGGLLASVLVGSPLASGCTFGGLGDYEIERCSVASTEAADVCSRLVSADPCMTYQCSVQTEQCELRPRDADRDGDASPECGGGDCDEADASNRSENPEQCDGQDNNCDGLVDEGVVAASEGLELFEVLALNSSADLQFTEGGSSGAVAAYVSGAPSGGSCIQGLRLGGQSQGLLGQGCSFLGGETTLAPRQPQVRLVGSGAAAVFVATSGCPRGGLGYRYSANLSSGASLDCQAAGAGVALPALGIFTGAAQALAAYYDVAFGERDTLDDCGSALSAPLVAVRIDGASSARPEFDLEGRLTLSSQTASLRPPAIAAVGDELWVASPDGASVSLWRLGAADFDAGVVPQPVQVSELVGSRGVALGVAGDRIAVAAEIGCVPDQQIRVAFGRLGQGEVAFHAAADASAQGGLATQPSVMWNAEHAEWVVTWVAAGPAIRARRFTEAGLPIGESVPVMQGASAGLATTPIIVRADVGGATKFRAVKLGCE